MEGCEGGEAIWKGCVGGYVSMVDENRSLSCTCMKAKRPSSKRLGVVISK